MLTDKMREHPAWACWVKFVEVFTLAEQHEITVADIQKLDNLVVEHSELFDKVPEYHGLKRPKHHFLSHLPVDVYNYGPMRGYWCFGFESFNAVIKKGTKRSGFKNEAVSCMRWWSLRSARECTGPQCATAEDMPRFKRPRHDKRGHCINTDPYVSYGE